MKNIKIILLLTALASVAVSGCQKFVEGYDVSPNRPSEVTPALLLTASEAATFSTVTGNMMRTPASWIQQLNGCSFQSADYSNYALYENDTDNDWSTIYSSTLINLKTLSDTYGAANPHYNGIAKVLMAYNYGIATDYWGDVPYSKSLNGLSLSEESFSPAYDAQSDVIAGIQKLLDEAIVELQKPASANTLMPTTDDLIYNGNTAKWTNVAYLLKARYAMRLQKQNGTSAVDATLAALANVGMAANGADDFQAIFPGGNNPNQISAFEGARGGYIRVNKQFVDLLKSKQDPRLSFYIATSEYTGTGTSIFDLKDSTYIGTETGGTDTKSSYVGSYLSGETTPVPIATYVEAKFLEAEAKLIKGDNAGAAAAYNAGVLASVKTVTGADAPTAYATAEASETDATISLAKIMTQKYLALYCQVEAYADWRRTGIPALTPNSSGVITSIPRRFPTCLNERANNKNVKAVQDLTQRVWWDK